MRAATALPALPEPPRACKPWQLLLVRLLVAFTSDSTEIDTDDFFKNLFSFFLFFCFFPQASSEDYY